MSDWTWRLAPLAAALVLAFLVAVPAAGQEQPSLMAGDFGLDNARWNGLSDFLALARARGHEVRAGTGLDLSKLGPDDRLIIVYPTQELDRQDLSRFVIDGGRILLVDDFGASTGLLDRLGIARVPVDDVTHKEHLLGRPGLPVFRPRGRHPLLDGVDEVVANHPTALATEGGAILPYDEEQFGLVYDMRLARGKVVVVGDSSLLINHMLGVADNRRLAANAVDYLCANVPDCKPYLLVGDFNLSGTYDARNAPDESVGDLVAGTLESLNEGIQNLDDYIPPHNAVYYASLLLMGGLVIFMVTIFPIRRAPRVRPRVGPPEGVRPLSEFEWNLHRFSTATMAANYALPVAILKAEFERTFFAKVAKGERVPPPGDAGRPAFLRRMAKRYVDRHVTDVGAGHKARAYKSTVRLLDTFSRLPPRHRLFLDSEASFNERDLTRIYAQVRAINKTLGVDDENDPATKRGAGRHIGDRQGRPREDQR